MRIYKHFLKHNSVTKELEYAPAGWEKSTRRFYRNLDLEGVFREDATSIRFVNTGDIFDKGGYHFIKDAVETDGITADIEYIRQIRDNFTYRFVDDYQGKLELNPKSGYIETTDFIEVKTIDSSILNKFITRQDIELNITDNQSLDNTVITSESLDEISFTPIDIYLRCISSGTSDETETVNNNNTITISASLYDGSVTLNEIGDNLSVNDPATNEIIYTNNKEQAATIIIDSLTGSYSDTLTYNPSNEIIPDNYTSKYLKKFVFSYGSNQVIKEIASEELNTGLQRPENFNGTFNLNSENLTFTLQPDETLKFRIITQWFADPSSQGIITSLTLVNNTEFYTFNFTEKTDGAEESAVSGYLLLKAFRQALRQITGVNDIFESNILQFTNYANLFVTNGFRIRGKEKNINFSFKDLFKALYSLVPVGIGYNIETEKFFLEYVETFYKPTYFEYEANDISDLEIKPSNRYYWNRLLNGYPKVEYEKFQGANETNTTSEHSSKFTTKQTYDIRNNFYGDSIGMELVRRLGLSSQDARQDDYNFIVDTESGETKQAGSGFSGFDGIEQYYNADYTPRQNIIRHTPLIGAEFIKETNEAIKFQKNSKNNNITYNGINEFDNIEQGEFLTLFIKPNEFTFDAIITNDFINELRDNPYRILKITDSLGIIRYGYILSCEFNPVELIATFELIETNINR